jgi:hypothetical protein
MDITDLEKKLGIEGMSADEQMAMVVALQKSAQEKALKARDETLGKSAELVVQGLKRIKTDIETRFEQLNSTIQNKVSSIQDGKDGRDGKNGLDGKQGLQGLNGKDGRDGRDGVDGVDGVSVTSAHIDFDGSLVIGLSSGVELNVGEVVAPDLAESIKVITNGGGTSQSVLDTLASLQTQINNLIPSQTGNSGKYLTTNGTALSWATVSGGGGGLSYQGTWNASTNTPTLTSSTGTNGYYYVVSTSGSTNLNGITDWVTGDWAMYNGTIWQKIDQTNSVTSVNSKTGAVVLNNVDISGFASIAAAGTTTTLTSSSAPNYVVTGSGGQTIQLPDATTLVNGALFSFNNNQSSGTIVVKNNSSTTIATIQSGGYISIVLLSNSIAAGSWDMHNYAPSNVSWSTNTFDYPGSITSATWNGNVVTYNRGGTGQSSAFVAGGIVYGGTTSALAVTSAGTSGQVLTSGGTGSPTWSTPTTGTVTSVATTAGTGISISGSPITSSGTLTITNTAPDQTVALTGGTGITTSGTYPNFTITNSAPDQTVAITAGTGITKSGTYPNFTITNSAPDQTVSLTGAGTTSVTGTYPNFTITSNDAYTGTVTSVTGTSPVVSSGGTTPAISLASGYGDTQNPYTSKTANYVLAAPNGSAGAPTFRSLVATDVPTLNQNTTGSAATLTTPRAIYGNNFDGSAALTQIIASTYGGTGNGFAKFSGPATAEKTFTLPNASATILTDNAAVTVLQGGTGATTASGARTNLGLVIGTDVLAPNGSAASLTSFPTFNQNTTGTAANITATSNSTLTTLSSLSLPGSQVSGNISGNSANVTGTVAIANGGTGQTTQQAAITALSGIQTSGQYLRSNGTNTLLSAIQAADVPTLNQNTTGSAASLSATLAIASGGTGQTTANTAFNALAPSQTSNSGKYLTTNGTNTSWASVSASAGGSDTYVQYNSGGALAGSANLTFNGTSLTATLSSSSTATTQSSGTNNTSIATTAFAYGTLSTANPGYQKLPSGLIIQWGNNSIADGGTPTITFPITFPTAVLSITTGTMTNNFSANQFANGWNMNSYSTSSFVPHSYTNGTNTMGWVAIGY